MRKSKATEALRVAQEVAVIRAALTKRGYRLRKRPKQAIWVIYLTEDRFYNLTYQPAPISSWVLHPQNSDGERCTLENIIQRAITKQSTGITGRVS
ncbi:MAG: hypothetical protein ICV85_22520 [Tolypothrix sp. T3-bin4]|nr:hypothetical protein [Tolypothrix sp. T3-bin4]